MKWLAFILLTACNLNPAVINNNKGNTDTGQPTPTISTTVTDQVLSDSVLTYCTFDKGPITGLVSGDFTLSNCTISSFTQISGNLWSFYLNPVIDGTFTCQLGAGTCSRTCNNGTTVSNLVSNTLSKTYDSGASYDLENAAEISVSRHYRGHVAAFSDCHDSSGINNGGGELLMTKYNKGATMFMTSVQSDLQDIYNFGRCDLGIYTKFDHINDRDANITTNRYGNPPTANSYASGDDSYKATMKTLVLFSRNSDFENVGQTLPITYSTGLSDDDFSSRGVTVRWDYYAKTTGTNYYRGTQAAGDAAIASYVSQVLSANGWFTNFTHWHWWVADYPDHYHALLQSLLSGYDVYMGDYQSVAEYYWAREAADSVSGSGNTITVNHTKKYPSSPYSRIRTPLWIKVDLTGTTFEGNDIALSNGLRPRSMGSNVFYIPILLDFTGNSSTVSLGIATGAPDYVNLTAPVPSRTGNAVTCDQEVKYTLWKVAKPTTLSTSVSSATIPSADNQTVNLTISTGLSITIDTEVKVLTDASNWFYATVVSYNSGTGALVLSTSGYSGSGTYSSWTIQRYYHLKTATVVERKLTYATSWTIVTTLDETNFTYYVGVINQDGISAVTP